MSPLLPIGAIPRAHGLSGLLRVRAFAAGSEALAAARRLFIDGRPYEIERSTRDHEGWLVKLRGIDDRNAADALRGGQVALPRDELPPPGEDELYVADLVGCAVLDREGATLGEVTAVENYGAHDLLVVERAGGPALVPFVHPIIVEVDLPGRRIVCDPPEGLLDLEGSAKGPS